MDNFKRPEDEINFSNLLKNPMRLIGLIFPITLILIIAVGMYWVYNMDSAFLNRIPDVKLKRDTVATELVQKKGAAVVGVNIVEAALSTKEQVAKGKELYAANCTSCHGTDGKGDGVAAAALNPKPRNFTSKDGWVVGRKFSEMYKTLEEGIAGTGMVSYNFLPIPDRVAIIHYLHSIMGDYPKNTPAELEELATTYKLNEGKAEPNQIPVAKAMKLLVTENSTNFDLDKKLATSIVDVNNPDFSLIKQTVDNPLRVATFLRKDKEWTASMDLFYTKISYNLNYSGFNSSFLRLNKEDINKLYNYFQNLMNIKQV
ncbi:MAG TPA: cytochrome c [Candidatus Kapabacteria bacterium]|nr:cytochrome c [Candidatus Kapabacteria bacterium]